ncbi:MAG: response regulator transcription factor [Bacteroidales bacterium]|jgi:DNA-binding NarL/FixJ family response regulator|nr:response regulator transcription factor [Bacteroidales bacterium]
MKQLNVLLVEDSAVFAMGLKLAIGTEDISINHVKSPSSAILFLSEHPDTDVAVVDISLESETDGLTLLESIRATFPSTRTMILSHYKHPGYILLAITSGAGAYLSKDSSPEEIREAIFKVADGYSLFFGNTIPKELINSLFGSDKELKGRKPVGLSAKEMEVLQLVTSGYSNTQIASALNIATTTVETYKERIKGKFGFDTIIECVAAAVARGIVKV